MNEIYNFSAGPATLADTVLKTAQEELLNYKGSGMSVLEISHRSALYTEINETAQNLMRELLNIPDGYQVLFLQGGASQQFAMVPMNLSKNKKFDYIETGSFSKKAIAEAKNFGDVTVVASSSDKNYTYIPKISDIEFSKDADYIHITSNNTIFGTKFYEYPEVEGVELVADMSSNILSEPLDVSKFGIIYAGAQKNLGPSGVTVVIVKDELLDVNENVANIFKYKSHAVASSAYNTPPVYSIYILKLTLEYIKSLGGVEAVNKLNVEKAGMLYDYLDNSDFYTNSVEVESRSIMNVVFTTPSKELDAEFVKGAEEIGLKFLKGHRSVGGMRASIYNAMPKAGIIKLIDYMDQFAKENGGK